MKTLSFIIICVCLTPYSAFGLDSTLLRQTKYYLDKIYNKSNETKQYIKALAYTYSANDLVVPNDKGEFVIARKGQCSFQQFKSIYTFSDSKKSIQVDTLEKTIVVSKWTQSIGQLDASILKDVIDIEYLNTSNAGKMMVLKFNSSSNYNKVELVFDTSSFKLLKLNIWFGVSALKDEGEIRKLEVKYLEISDKIPSDIDVCMADEIIVIDKSKGILIKEKKYSNYEIINLLSN
jgi:hypothetical protein